MIYCHFYHPTLVYLMSHLVCAFFLGYAPSIPCSEVDSLAQTPRINDMDYYKYMDVFFKDRLSAQAAWAGMKMRKLFVHGHRLVININNPYATLTFYAASEAASEPQVTLMRTPGAIDTRISEH